MWLGAKAVTAGSDRREVGMMRTTAPELRKSSTYALAQADCPLNFALGGKNAGAS